MKKLTTILLALSLILSFAGCQQPAAETPDDTRVNAIEKQIEDINSSIEELEGVDAEHSNYIAELEKQIEDLQTQINCLKGIHNVACEYAANDNKTHVKTCGCGAEVTEDHTFNDENICICGQSPFVAAVDGTGYMSFEEALANWTDGTTLKLHTNIQYHDGDIKIVNKSVTLDLNGKTLSLDPDNNKFIRVGVNEWGSNYEYILTPGQLTIRDSGKGGTIKAHHQTVSVADTLYLESGTLANWVANDGNFYMSGGKISGQDRDGLAPNGISNGGKLYLSGGEVHGRFPIWTMPGSETHISGTATFIATNFDNSNLGYGIFVQNDATVTISGTPTFTGEGTGALTGQKAVTLNTQPAAGETWSVACDTAPENGVYVFAIPGENIELDPSRFVSVKEGYTVQKLEDGSLALVATP